MKNTKNWWKNIPNHFFAICKHKWFVYKYCNDFGITWRGITHDLSKFHPTEFIESCKYYIKGASPIPQCKLDKGYSNAWFHHRGHNDHHYEYWVDNLDKGGEPIKMSFEAMLEMLADWIAAGRAYKGKSFTIKDEYEWVKNTANRNPKIHPITLKFLTEFLYFMSCEVVDKKHIGRNFNTYKILYENGEV